MTTQVDIPFEIKQIEDDGSFSGYASMFYNVDNHQDMVLKGAFKDSVQTPSAIKFLWQHKMDEPIGTIHQLYEDEQGLFIKGKLLLDVERAREAYALLKSGAINGLSIGYRVQDAELDASTGVRLLKNLELLEVSLVTFPANEAARVRHVKNTTPNTIREFEIFLRDAGFSRSEAKSITAAGYTAHQPQRDAAMDDDELIALERALDKAILSLTL